MKTVSVLVADTGGLIGERIECADTSIKRLVGLLGRSTLNAGDGIWIQPSSGVHTFGMQFPIDVVGLDKNLRIVRLWPCLKPQRLTAISTQVQSVLELAAGQIDARAIEVGQVLHVLNH